MAEPSVEFHRTDRAEAGELLDELSGLYREVFSEPPYRYRDEHVRLFRERFAVQHQRESAGLVLARSAGQLVGFAFGLSLASSKSWWFDLATDVDPGLIEEPPGRTFALLELLVREPWRRSGVAHRLHDLLLENRAEERATLTVRPDASAAQAFYATLGWYKVAQKYNPLPDSPLFDVLVKDLDRSG